MNRPEYPESGSSCSPRLPIEAHLDRLFAYAYRLTGSPDLAEDLTQQSLLIAQQRIHQLRDPEKLGGWLLRILRNAFLRGRRRPGPIPASQLDFAIEEVVCEPEPDGVHDEEQLRNALLRLPETFRVVVLMFYFEELSYQEIANELELPVGTVMSRLSRAKGHLRRLLTAAGELSS